MKNTDLDKLLRWQQMFLELVEFYGRKEGLHANESYDNEAPTIASMMSYDERKRIFETGSDDEKNLLFARKRTPYAGEMTTNVAISGTNDELEAKICALESGDQERIDLLFGYELMAQLPRRPRAELLQELKKEQANRGIRKQGGARSSPVQLQLFLLAVISESKRDDSINKSLEEFFCPNGVYSKWLKWKFGEQKIQFHVPQIKSSEDRDPRATQSKHRIQQTFARSLENKLIKSIEYDFEEKNFTNMVEVMNYWNGNFIFRGVSPPVSIFEGLPKKYYGVI